MFLDEFSLIGAKAFALIEQRCRQAKGRSRTWFGGLSIVLFGDTKLLPPPFDISLCNMSKLNEQNCNPLVKAGLNAFKLFRSVFFLKIIIGN